MFVISFLGKQQVPKHGGQLFSETARFGNGLKLPIDVLRIALLSNANGAHDDYVTLRINPIDHPVI